MIIIMDREQIAREWVRDLDVVIERGAHIMYSINQKMRRGDLDQEPGIDDKDKLGQILGNNWVPVPPISSAGDAIFERMDLSLLADAYEDESGYTSSPLRKGNFDLLMLLATKESIRRVMLSGRVIGEYEDGEEKDRTYATLNSASINFLQTFYEDRADHFGTKSNRYHMADAFIERLIATPSRMVADGMKGGNKPVFIDPVIISEVILKERERVAKEWKVIASNSPLEHLDIRRLQLDIMMGL